MLEPLSRYFMDRQRWTRMFAATSSALLIWFIGLGTLLSFSVMQNLRVLGRHFFEWVQWLTTSWFAPLARSEEHTSELQSLMRISYDVFCLKKKKKHQTTQPLSYSTPVIQTLS